MSKRILRMARLKRFRNGARLLRLQARGKPIPSYHYVIPDPSSAMRKSEFLCRCWSPLRSQKSRRLLLKLLFSPVGDFLGAINEMRNNLFAGYRHKK